MWDNTTTAPSSGRGSARDVWPAVAVLAAYGLVRIAALVWGIVRDGPPESALAWSDVVSDGGAAVQGVAAAAVLARLSLRRQAWAWSVGVLGVGAALFGATVWVVLGDTNALRQVRQILLAVAFAVVTVVVCGWRPGWAVRDDGDLDLVRVRRAGWTMAWCSAAIGTVSGLAILAAHPMGAVHRLADLLLRLGLLGGFVAVLSVMVVVGEQRRQAAEAARQQLYRRLAEGRGRDDQDV
jgi:hypothetical protein